MVRTQSTVTVFLAWASGSCAALKESVNDGWRTNRAHERETLAAGLLFYWR